MSEMRGGGGCCGGEQAKPPAVRSCVTDGSRRHTNVRIVGELRRGDSGRGPRWMMLDLAPSFTVPPWPLRATPSNIKTITWARLRGGSFVARHGCGRSLER